MFILDNDALDVALVDQFANFFDEVAALHLYFFDDTLKVHILEYVSTRMEVPRIR